MLHATPPQLRGARAMLGWSMLDLARAAGVPVSTVAQMERGDPQPVSQDLRESVEAALGKAGVVLLIDDGDGAGVRLGPA